MTFITRFGMQLFVPVIEQVFGPFNIAPNVNPLAGIHAAYRLAEDTRTATKRARAKLPREHFAFPALRAQDPAHRNTVIISRAERGGSSMIGDLNFWQKKMNAFIQTPAGDWFFINPAKPSFTPAAAPMRQQKVA